MDDEVSPPTDHSGTTSTSTSSQKVCQRIDDIIQFLVCGPHISFKSQQRNENDLDAIEKNTLATDLYNTNKLVFLQKFGKYLDLKHLECFQRLLNNGESLSNNIEDQDAIQLLLRDLVRQQKSLKKTVKNRRFEALKRMITSGDYFSEIEMMKRNPPLYHQCIGRYLSEEEKRTRDRIKFNETSTVSQVLLEIVERGSTSIYNTTHFGLGQSEVEEDDNENDFMDTGQPERPTSLWGEFAKSKILTSERQWPNTFDPKAITDEDRDLLKQEFINGMYNSFLDGLDVDFDYSTVDENTIYDDYETIDNDEQEKYFDSEEALINNSTSSSCISKSTIINRSRTTVSDPTIESSSEDELDVYMSGLNQNPDVQKLSKDLTRL